MTEEIKKILEYLKNNTFIPDETKRKYKILHRDEVNKLLNYITNLQKENVDLKKLCDKYEEEHKTTFGTWKTVIVRNEKAVEYIEERKNLSWYADGVFVYELLNILQGDDE